MPHTTTHRQKRSLGIPSTLKLLIAALYEKFNHLCARLKYAPPQKWRRITFLPRKSKTPHPPSEALHRMYGHLVAGDNNALRVESVYFFNQPGWKIGDVPFPKAEGRTVRAVYAVLMGYLVLGFNRMVRLGCRRGGNQIGATETAEAVLEELPKWAKEIKPLRTRHVILTPVGEYIPEEDVMCPFFFEKNILVEAPLGLVQKHIIDDEMVKKEKEKENADREGNGNKRGKKETKKGVRKGVKTVVKEEVKKRVKKAVEKAVEQELKMEAKQGIKDEAKKGASTKKPSAAGLRGKREPVTGS